jgi:hypothetical protein
MMVGQSGLCVRCAAEHEQKRCQHVPNVAGATGLCLGRRCVMEHAPIQPLPVLCVSRMLD